MGLDLVCIGCLSVDTTFRIPVFPRPNSECFVEQMYTTHGGGAANVAAYSVFYGGLKAGLVSKIGEGREGQELVKGVKQYGVCTKGVSAVQESMSTRIAVIQSLEGIRTYLVYLGAVGSLSVADLPSEYIAESKLFYVAPCTPRIHKEFIKFGVRNRKVIAFNPGSVYFQEGRKKDLMQLLGYVDFLFVNAPEALEYSGEKSLQAAGFALRRFGVKKVIITTGKSGCVVISEHESVSCQGHQVEPVSQVGAGDAFAAGFLAEFLRTSSIESAMKFGNSLAAFAVTRPSVRESTPDRERFLQFLVRNS